MEVESRKESREAKRMEEEIRRKERKRKFFHHHGLGDTEKQDISSGYLWN